MVCSFTKRNAFQDVQLFHAGLWLSVLRGQGRAWPGSGERQRVSSVVSSSPCNLGKEENSPRTRWGEAASRGVNRTEGNERRWRFSCPRGASSKTLPSGSEGHTWKMWEIKADCLTASLRLPYVINQQLQPVN